MDRRRFTLGLLSLPVALRDRLSAHRSSPAAELMAEQKDGRKGMAAAAASAGNGSGATSGETRLWYDRPATVWTEALPVGNGRLGAMVFGGTAIERIQLNEESLWDGYRRDCNNPEALTHLPEVRRLLFAGENQKAQEVAAQHLMAVPSRIKSYQTLGDLYLECDGASEDLTGYRRELDLSTAMARTTFRTAGGATITREVFLSAPDDVLVVRLSADRPGALSFRARLTRAEPPANDAEAALRKQWWGGEKAYAGKQVLGENGALPDGSGLTLSGRIDTRSESDPENRGMRFAARARIKTEGGSVRAEGGTLRVEGADAATLLLTAATDYRGSNPEKRSEEVLQRAAGRSYADLRAAHVAEHDKLFGRVTLHLGGEDRSGVPTDARLKAVQEGKEDNGLAALYFQYGRYLLLASSRKPGTLPANLQGVWNEFLNAPWNSDFHTNINLQMNYWLAETCNLAECHEQLLDYTTALIEPGHKTAKVHYGCEGFVVHHLSDVWGFTAPADGIHGIWPMGAAWLAQHAWEHYAFSGDTAYLKRQGYPILREAARFLLDYLVAGPDGKLVTCPSHSPENKFRAPDGSTSVFTYGATMDLMIVHDCLTKTASAAEALGVDEPLRREIAEKLAKLQPLQIGKDGRLQEWIAEYEEPEPGHRHISHAFGLYPGDQISPTKTPELAAALRKSLEYRLSHGGGHTGWSRAWITVLYARFGDGAKAHENLTALLAKSTLPNLFDNHPPFQIDGNFGGTAAVAEMLVQSHTGEIHLLPALPPAWTNGSVSGLRARGGITVDLTWRDGKLADATLTAAQDTTAAIRIPGDSTVRRISLKGGKATPVLPT